MIELAFTVAGVPVGQGRLSFLGKGRVVHSNAEQLLPWRDSVARAAQQAAPRSGWTFTDQPVFLLVTFYLERPKSHFGVKGLRVKAPAYPAKRPDLDHLVRAVGDALTASGVAWVDDSQIVTFVASKRWAGTHADFHRAGCAIEIRTALLPEPR